MRHAAAVLLLVLAAAPASAGGKGPPEGDARLKAVSRHLDATVLAVGHFDLTRPDADELVVLLASVSPRLLGALGDLESAELRKAVAASRAAGAADLFVVYSFADGLKDPVFVLAVGDGNADAVARYWAKVAFPEEMHAGVIDGNVVIATREAFDRHQRLKGAAPADLAKALAAAAEHTGRFAVVPGADARRCFEEIIPVLPAEVGGGPSSVLTRGVKWVAIGVDGPPKLALHLVVQAVDEPAAVKLHAWSAAALKALGRTEEVKRSWPAWDELAMALQPTRSGDRLVLKLDNAQMTALVKPLVGKGQFAGYSKRAMNSLKQLALAMHVFADAHKGTFPTPASYSKDGKPLLSWRVHVLPYIEQLHLYQQFHLDEPWDSEHNKKLIAQMPAIFAHPAGKGKAEGKTPFVVPVGKDTIFPGGKGIGFRDITDGTSNTLLILTAADADMVTWTRPDDWQFDPKAPHRGLVDKERPVLWVALADGSVRSLPATVSADLLRALMTRNGGEVIDDVDR
jgi:hypothetical protein